MTIQEAAFKLREWQTQIIYGPNVFGDMADAIDEFARGGGAQAPDLDSNTDGINYELFELRAKLAESERLNRNYATATASLEAQLASTRASLAGMEKERDHLEGRCRDIAAESRALRAKLSETEKEREDFQSRLTSEWAIALQLESALEIMEVMLPSFRLTADAHRTMAENTVFSARPAGSCACVVCGLVCKAEELLRKGETC